MSNQLSTQIDQLSQLSSSVFESITDGKPSNIDDLERLRVITKTLKEVYDEAKEYHGSNIGENQLSHNGVNYMITKTISDGETKSYNPNKIFQRIKEIQPELLEEFIQLISITKSGFEKFTKENNLNIKIFNDCLDVEVVEPTITYKIKLIK